MSKNDALENMVDGTIIAQRSDHKNENRFDTLLSSTNPDVMMTITEYCFRHHISEACIVEKFEVQEWLQRLLQEDEALATFSVDGQYYPGFCIIPDDEAIEYLDIQASLEETLSRIIGAEAESDGSDPVFCSFTLDQLIHSVLLADTEEEDDEENALEIDFGYRIHDVITSFNRVSLSAVSFQKKLYERYKFFWMMDNDITIQDAFSDMRDFCKKNPRYENLPNNQVFEAWEAECGFSGLEYSDFGTFVINEYQTDLRLLQSDDDKMVWEMDQI